MTPTPEQLAVCAARGRRIKVKAFAGAAKTSTQELYARTHPGERILYIAFSKAVQREGEARFPGNTTCKTTHSLAFSMAVRMFGGKGRNGVKRDVLAKIGDIRPSEIAKALSVSVMQAYLAQRTLTAWFATTDLTITEEHIPPELLPKIVDFNSVVSLAREILRRMNDPDDLVFKLPHDGYLKAFCLFADPLKGFDTVLLDEAQDTSPVTLHYLLKQDVKLVLVGDPHQSIFGFRGAIDAMDRVESDATLYLTHSFRFGDGIAEIANMMLGRLKREEKLLVGAGEPKETRFWVDRSRPFAVVSRTNAAIFEEAVSLRRDPRPFHFVGGPASLRFDKIVDAHWLWRNELARVRDPYLRSFGDFGELRQLADDTEDAELRMLTKVVLKYGPQVPALIEEIEAKHRNTLPEGGLKAFDGITFCTAHKSKGLEFRQVALTDDFPLMFDKEKNAVGPGDLADEDVNLLYVAVTRAKEAIALPDSLSRWATLLREGQQASRETSPLEAEATTQ